MIFPREPMTPDQAIVYAAGQLEAKVEQLETDLADALEQIQRMRTVLNAFRPTMEGMEIKYIQPRVVWDKDPGFKLVAEYYGFRKEEDE